MKLPVALGLPVDGGASSDVGSADVLVVIQIVVAVIALATVLVVEKFVDCSRLLLWWHQGQ